MEAIVFTHPSGKKWTILPTEKIHLTMDEIHTTGLNFAVWMFEGAIDLSRDTFMTILRINGWAPEART